MCLACLVPTVTGLAIVLMHRATIAANPIPEYLYGTYGSFDRFVITVVVPVIACAGGPLLGVAVARWLRFPGAALLSVLVVLIWGNIAAYVPGNSSRFGHGRLDRCSPGYLHMVTPYTAFGSGDGDGEHISRVMTSYTGSPGWYAVWTLALCGLAVMRSAVARRSRARCAAWSAGRSSCWSRSPWSRSCWPSPMATRPTSARPSAGTRAVALGLRSGG